MNGSISDLIKLIKETGAKPVNRTNRRSGNSISKLNGLLKYSFSKAINSIKIN